MATNKYPPSIREICSALNLKSPATVHVHVNNLIEKGYLKRSPNSNHALELLTPNEFENENIISVPLLGKVTAGNPIEAIENPRCDYNLGLQWHPELFDFDHEDSINIFDSFIEKSSNHDKQKVYKKTIY